MKNPLIGFICTCLLVFAGTLPGRAQEQKPKQQPGEPAASVEEESPVQQAAPAAQTPPQQAPQTPVPPPDTEAPQRGRIPEPPPPPPKVPDVRRPGESGYYIGVSGWFPTQKPTYDRGKESIFTGISHIQMQGSPKVAKSAEIGIAAGLHNSLRFIYTDIKAAGNFTAGTDLVTWGSVYPAGTYLSTNYHVQSGKLSYEFLTWPYPVGSRKVRLKTLYQVQLTQVGTVFDSPKNYYDSAGNLKLDSQGNPIDLSARHSKRILSPELGLGFSYYPSRHVRFEANATGFAWPHGFAIWDTDASLNLRLLGHLEFRVGGRAFSFKTSPKADYYIKGTMAAAFIGLRWYSNSE